MDTEVRARFASHREATALCRVAERSGPLQYIATLVGSKSPKNDIASVVQSSTRSVKAMLKSTMRSPLPRFKIPRVSECDLPAVQRKSSQSCCSFSVQLCYQTTRKQPRILSRPLLVLAWMQPRVVNREPAASTPSWKSVAVRVDTGKKMQIRNKNTVTFSSKHLKTTHKL